MNLKAFDVIYTYQYIKYLILTIQNYQIKRFYTEIKALTALLVQQKLY